MSARWHTGESFVIQDEHANGPFGTHAILAWDQDEQRYFARTIENHGFARDYTLEVNGNVSRRRSERQPTVLN